MRGTRRLTARQVATTTEPGLYADGDGLYLRVSPAGTRGWIYRYQIGGRRRDMGLGRTAEVSLARARELAGEARALVRDGRDPIEAREAARAATAAEAAARAAPVHTVRAAAEALLAVRRPGWSSPKSAQAWEATLGRYVYPVIGDLDVAAVDTEAVLRVLTPLWAEVPETASRVRGRLEAILDYARVREWRGGDNPARWRGHLDHLLARPHDLAPVRHHRAVPWRAMPAVWQQVRAADGLGARALELVILTACRVGEVRWARWDEIDREARLWVIPAERMKARRAHRVPLTAPALDLLRRRWARRIERGPGAELVFPGQRRGRPISDMTLTTTCRRLGLPAVPHGFRSSFRDWAAETTAESHEVCEAALAHAPRDRVVAAYQRGDLLDRRRRLMDAWAAYLAGEGDGAAGS
ncbi:tyrosine-type recombinase/integrase [Roseospira goensis]|uniref:Integrase n=1 Tax=Roseospira goensis TaxID=391922 RepID=A0A7W6S310_9PROT|nr:site-specific integrase [Roseospira goensis]MBB4287914.1 integrase [Roseospira goensis]